MAHEHVLTFRNTRQRKLANQARPTRQLQGKKQIAQVQRQLNAALEAALSIATSRGSPARSSATRRCVIRADLRRQARRKATVAALVAGGTSPGDRPHALRRPQDALARDRVLACIAPPASSSGPSPGCCPAPRLRPSCSSAARIQMSSYSASSPRQRPADLHRVHHLMSLRPRPASTLRNAQHVRACSVALPRRGGAFARVHALVGDPERVGW